MRRPRKKYLVIISEAEKYPMKQWLRENRQHVPEGKDPDDPNIPSAMWRGILKRNGWTDRETNTEVHLIFPAEDDEDELEAPNTFALEQHLRDYIASDIKKIPFGRTLELYRDQDGRNGVEYPTDTGRIDILAISTTDNQEFFVIELKLSRGSDQAIGQLMRYMSWVEEEIPDCRKVNGIIVAQTIDERLKRSVRMISSCVELFKYELKFDLNLVFSSPTPEADDSFPPTPPKPGKTDNERIREAAAAYHTGGYPSKKKALEEFGVKANPYNRTKFNKVLAQLETN